MKQNKKLPTMRGLIFAADVAAALVLFGAVASAQDAATTPKPEHNQQGDETLKKRVDIVISNGHFINDSGRDTEASIGNIVEYARQKYRMNIALSPGVAGVVVRDVTVRGADIESFFQALTVA